jgi:hypothetical protein
VVLTIPEITAQTTRAIRRQRFAGTAKTAYWRMPGDTESPYNHAPACRSQANCEGLQRISEAAATLQQQEGFLIQSMWQPTYRRGEREVIDWEAAGCSAT